MFDDSMLHFPDSNTIKKRVNGGDWIDHVLRVDPYGNIGLDMNSNVWFLKEWKFFVIIFLFLRQVQSRL